MRPLNNHLKGDASKLKAHKVLLSWKAKEAFNLLKQALLKALVLKFADYLKPFVLETDASSNGLRAVLLQEGDDKWGFRYLIGWFVGGTSCTLQTLYACLMRGFGIGMVGILNCRVLHLSLRCDSWYASKNYALVCRRA